MTILTKQQERVLKVLERIIESVRNDDDEAGMWAHELEATLDNLYGQDAFGSEGQCDPRGDMRDEAGWSVLSRVEGVDE